MRRLAQTSPNAPKLAVSANVPLLTGQTVPFTSNLLSRPISIKGIEKQFSQMHLSQNFGAFGEVWASDLTKRMAQNPQIVVV